MTAINGHYDRVSMHGLRKTLLEAQAEAIGIPLTMIELPEEPSMETYNNRMNIALQQLKEEKFEHAGFGDIFLEDLRGYRENQLKPFGISGIFPLWQRDTDTMVRTFLDLGFKAIVVCIKAALLDESFVGRVIDEDFLRDLPKNVDPCGENGEVHTFCFDGPLFKYPVKFQIGEKVFRSYRSPGKSDSEATDEAMGFWFVDLLPVDS